MRLLTLFLLLLVFSTSGLIAQGQDNFQTITVENANRTTEIARLGRGWMQDIAWSPNGQSLAVSATTGVYIHDVSNQDSESLYLPHDYDVYRNSGEVVFSPRRARLARVGPENSTLWDINQSEIIAIAPTLEEGMFEYRSPFRFVGEQTLEIRVVDNTIQVTDVDTGDVVYELQNLEPDAYYFFNSDASRLVVDPYGTDAPMTVWNLAEARRLYSYSVRNTFTTSLILWSPDGHFLSVWDDGLLEVWDSRSNSTWEVETISGFPDGRFIWSPDSRYVAIRIDDGLVRVYDASGGELLAERSLGSGTRRLLFSPDSTHIIAETYILDQRDTIVDWAFHTDQTRSLPYNEISEGYIMDMELSSDGQVLAIADVDNRVRLIDFNNWAQIDMLRYGGDSHAVVFSPDSRVLASASETHIQLTEAGWDNSIWLWSLANLSRITELNGHRARIQGLDFSADGQYLASAADWYDNARLWNTDTGTTVAQLGVSGDGSGIDAIPLIDAFFVPGQHRIGVYPSDLTVVRWWHPEVDIDTSDQPPTGLVSRSANISNDGTLYATAGRDSGVFCTDSGSYILSFGWTTSVAFNPSDVLIALGSTTNDVGLVEVWSLETQTQLYSLPVHMDGTIGGNRVWVAFSPEGTLLAAGGSDKLLLVDTDTGEVVATLNVSAKAQILSLAFSPDGKRIAIGTDDGTIRLWGVPSR
ncbi:MAG: hypothetical protein KC546_14295 [Anaerolineae bacterium]|nr:hypothetical protein [Anaerolineae bacterium]MCA9889546.1 hypothetical protein [Anaerolineae bacterium]MCA9891446.1 hypothetical protein [Anaerolineae bacterium]